MGHARLASGGQAPTSGQLLRSGPMPAAAGGQVRRMTPLGQSFRGSRPLPPVTARIITEPLGSLTVIPLGWIIAPQAHPPPHYVGVRLADRARRWASFVGTRRGEIVKTDDSVRRWILLHVIEETAPAQPAASTSSTSWRTGVTAPDR
jgi:hypothetical protein